MSVAEWDNEYARLARVASQVRSSPGGTPGRQQEQQQLQQHLGRLDHQLNGLPISPAEVQRRRRLIQHLQSNSGGMPVPQGSPAAPSSSPHQHHPQSQMAMAMRQQDDMIDELAIGVGRLRDQTQIIGDEARMHVNLLNDMEGNLDAAHAGLESETRRAAQLKEDQSIWRLQLTVAGLSVLLVLLILAGLN